MNIVPGVLSIVLLPSLLPTCRGVAVVSIGIRLGVGAGSEATFVTEGGLTTALADREGGLTVWCIRARELAVGASNVDVLLRAAVLRFETSLVRVLPAGILPGFLNPIELAAPP